MSISITDLESISYRFDFAETKFQSNTKEEQEKWDLICQGDFALSNYSGTGPNSGEWISVRVSEDEITIEYRTGGLAGYSDESTTLSADATERDIEQAIEKYM